MLQIQGHSSELLCRASVLSAEQNVRGCTYVLLCNLLFYNGNRVDSKGCKWWLLRAHSHTSWLWSTSTIIRNAKNRKWWERCWKSFHFTPNDLLGQFAPPPKWYTTKYHPIGIENRARIRVCFDFEGSPNVAVASSWVSSHSMTATTGWEVNSSRVL